MKERLRVWLRGEHNSVVYRFVLLPWRWVRYWLPIALFGGSEMLVWAKLTDKSILPSIRTMPSAHYMGLGRTFHDYVVSLGLRPGERLLDYGCGPMRAGVHFAKYLGPGHYVGADTSRSMLRRGEFVMTSSDIARKDFHAVRILTAELEELEYFTFDWIVCYSSLQYLSDRDFETTIRAFRRILADTGQIVISVPTENERAEVRRKRHHYRDQATLERIVSAAGFVMDYSENADPERGPVGGYLTLHVGSAESRPRAVAARM